MIQETIKTIFLSLSSALSPPCTYKFREIINSKLKLALRFPTIEAVAKKDRKSSVQNMGREGCLACLSVPWFKRAGQLSVKGRVGNKRFYRASDHICYLMTPVTQHLMSSCGKISPHMQFAALAFLSVFLSNVGGQKKFWNQIESAINYFSEF